MNDRTSDAGQQASIATPWKTNEMIRRYGLVMKKSLGQNFLIDTNILQKIVAAAQLNENIGVLEIGPGIGALTQMLASQAGKVVAVEIDRTLIPVLNEVLAQYPHASVVHDDILKVDIAEFQDEHFADSSAVHVVANLPYYATTPIIMHLLQSGRPPASMVFMMQKEVADRLTAGPGGKDYGSLSIAVQYYCETERVLHVPRTVFVPRPNVDSTVVRLLRRDKPAVEVEDEAFFFRVVKSAFSQRRKTLNNNMLSQFFDKSQKSVLSQVFDTCGIDPSRRGETLTMEEFARLSRALRPVVSDQDETKPDIK